MLGAEHSVYVLFMFIVLNCKGFPRFQRVVSILCRQQTAHNVILLSSLLNVFETLLLTVAGRT